MSYGCSDFVSDIDQCLEGVKVPLLTAEELVAFDMDPLCEADELRILAERACRAISAVPEMAQVLRDVRDYWAGGDCPPELMARINAVLATTGEPITSAPAPDSHGELVEAGETIEPEDY
jgi:hypothetical protein